MAEPAVPAGRPLRVAELTRYLKYLIEGDDLLGAVSVRGEVSSLSRSASGHVYLTLKDNSGQIACVMFRREAAQHADSVRGLRTGLSVVVHGFVTVYEPRSSFQLYVTALTAEGEGDLAQRLQQLRTRLEREGLFAEERKRPLPPFPQSLALVTSPGSQAYHDVLHRLRSQYPFVEVIEVGVSVQGDGAADEMAMALDIVNRLTDAEIILLVRGGGAAEELAAFNEERLARAIFGSRIPVVTGIGHETDHTIADLVADRRAATPSLAAAVAVPDMRAMVREVGRLHDQLRQATTQRLRLDRRRWLEANRALLRASPTGRLALQRKRGNAATLGLQRAMDGNLRARRAHLQALRAQLIALDPLAILNRGYAVLTDPVTGQVISRTGDARPGARVVARVSDGTFAVRVEE